MPHVRLADGASIHYRLAGSGERKVLFVHGNLASGLWWEPVLELLPRGFQAFALDLPGCGQSPETGERHTLGYLARVVDQFSQAVGLTRHLLVGHSMGGGISQLYALAHPDRVERLALINSMPGDGFHVLYHRGEENLRRVMKDRQLLEKALRAVMATCQDQRLIARIVEDSAGASDQVFLEHPVTMHEANWFHRLHELKLPVLFIHGEQDELVVPAETARTAAAIPGARFLTFPACGHSPNVEQPARLVAELLQFWG